MSDEDPGRKTADIIATQEARIDTLRIERDQLRAMLSDALETETSQPSSWLSQLAGRRGDLLTHLRAGECVGDFEACFSCERGDYQNHSTHQCECGLAELLRIVGGPEETQRQVDAAHEAALVMNARSHYLRTAIETTEAALRRPHLSASHDPNDVRAAYQRIRSEPSQLNISDRLMTAVHETQNPQRIYVSPDTHEALMERLRQTTRHMIDPPDERLPLHFMGVRVHVDPALENDEFNIESDG